jgi:hypothetical protein
MFDSHLVPPGTVITAKGEGAPVDIGAASGKTLLLSLKITEIVEQQALDLSVWGSADGAAWDAKPLAAFPQKFYAGEHPLLLDLASRPEVKFLRARWDVNRWGRGPETAMFKISVAVKEVPQELLQEAGAEAGTRR